MKFVLGAVGISLLLILTSCFPGSGGGPPSQPAEEGALAVESVTVTEGILNEYIEASGTISGANEAYVVSETQGVIEAVNFDLGDRVSKGDVLVKVDDKIQQINVEQAKTEYDNAQLDYNAVKNLFDNGSASQSELNRAKGALSGAKSRYEQALKAYNDCTLTAPIDGLIAERDPAVTLGNYLSAGLRVARIVDTDSLKLEIGVGEREVGLLAEGLEADICIPTCSRIENTGSVTAIAAGSDPATGSFPVIITWKNRCPEKVRAGMTASVKIRTTETDPVIIVPTRALFTVKSQSYVYIEEDGKAAEREVETGDTLGDRTEITSGLTGGENLIISGITALREGRSVQTTSLGESGSWR